MAEAGEGEFDINEFLRIWVLICRSPAGAFLAANPSARAAAGGYLIENKAATFMMRVDGDSMKDAGILDGDLLVVARGETGEWFRRDCRGQWRVHREALASLS